MVIECPGTEWVIKLGPLLISSQGPLFSGMARQILRYDRTGRGWEGVPTG